MRLGAGPFLGDQVTSPDTVKTYDASGRVVRSTTRPGIYFERTPHAVTRVVTLGAGRPAIRTVIWRAPAKPDTVGLDSFDDGGGGDPGGGGQPVTSVLVNPGGGGAWIDAAAKAISSNAYLAVASDLAGLYRSFDSGTTWEGLGFVNGLTGTQIACVSWTPSGTTQTLWAATERALYKSTDAGSHFTEVYRPGCVPPGSPKLPGHDEIDPTCTYTGPKTSRIYIADLAYAPSDPNYIYGAARGTADPDSIGLYVVYSIDGGANWGFRKTSLLGGMQDKEKVNPVRIAVNALDPLKIWVLGQQTRLATPPRPQLLRSDDGGNAFTVLGLPSQVDVAITDFALDPVDTGTVWISATTPLPSGTEPHTFRSANGGMSWTSYESSGLGPIGGAVRVDPRPSEHYHVTVIDVVQGSQDDASSKYGVWTSTNSTPSFTRTNPPPGDWNSGWRTLTGSTKAYAKNQYGVGNTLVECPQMPDSLFWLTGQWAYSTSDRGGHWRNLFTKQAPLGPGWWITRGLDNVVPYAAAFTKAIGNRFYLGYADIGLWRTDDGGLSLRNLNPADFTGTWNGQGGNCTTVIADKVDATLVIAAIGPEADTEHLLKSTNAGYSWNEVGPATGFIYGLSDNGVTGASRKLFCTIDGAVYRSIDNGDTWESVLDQRGQGYYFRVTATDGVDANYVYAGGEGGLWRSGSEGCSGTWGSMVTSAPFGGAYDPNKVVNQNWPGIHAIACADSGSSRVWVACYETSDMGSTSAPLRAFSNYGTTPVVSAAPTGSNFWYRTVALAPGHPSRVYVGTSKQLKGATSIEIVGTDGLWLTDSGMTGSPTWYPQTTGRVWPFCSVVASDPNDITRVLVGESGTGFRRLEHVP